jgi:hypothetical protein
MRHLMPTPLRRLVSGLATLLLCSAVQAADVWDAPSFTTPARELQLSAAGVRVLVDVARSIVRFRHGGELIPGGE